MFLIENIIQEMNDINEMSIPSSPSKREGTVTIKDDAEGAAATKSGMCCT
jgi:hypothetical protein